MPLREQVKVIFRVRCEAPQGYKACVVGSCLELGIWNPRLAKVMKQDAQDPTSWSTDVRMRRQDSVKYRYFLCTPVWRCAREDPWDLPRVHGLSILTWESAPTPRVLDVRSAEVTELPWVDMGRDEQRRRVEESGGWLVGCTQMRLTACGPRAITIFDDPQGDMGRFTVNIRCQPVDYMRLGQGTAVWDKIINKEPREGCQPTDGALSEHGKSPRISPTQSKQPSPRASTYTLDADKSSSVQAGTSARSNTIATDKLGVQFSTPQKSWTKQKSSQLTNLSVGEDKSTNRSSEISKRRDMPTITKDLMNKLARSSSIPLSKFSSTPMLNVRDACALGAIAIPPFSTAVTALKLEPRPDPKKQLAVDTVGYRAGDLVTFCCDTVFVEALGFRFDLTLCIGDPKSGSAMWVPVGFCHVPPLYLWGDATTVPIMNSMLQHIGDFHLQYTVIQPLSRLHMTMETSFQNFVETTPQAPQSLVEAGLVCQDSRHREITCIRENTLATVKAAAQRGARWVELTVQLSSDRTPVLYHSGHVTVSSSGRCPLSQPSVMRVCVGDMSCVQLQSLRLSGLSPHTLHHCDDVTKEDTVPFPSLTQCLDALDPSIAVVLVVHCHDTVSSTWGDQVDAVLCPLFERFRNRDVVLSSLQPDVCVLMHKKQNLFPVIIGCTGTPCEPSLDPPRSRDKLPRDPPSRDPPSRDPPSRDPPSCDPPSREEHPRDPRASHLRSVLCMARAERMLGVWLPLPLVVLVPDVCAVARRMGLCVFVWSTQDVDRPMVNWLLNKQGVDAAVTDIMTFQCRDDGLQEMFQMPSASLCRLDLTHATPLPQPRPSLPPLTCRAARS